MAKRQTSKTTGPVAKTAAPKSIKKEFKDGIIYTFRGNGIAPSLLNGMEYKVSAFQARLFTERGFGQVID